MGTNPAVADTDGDGIDDYAEIHTYGSSPTVSNSITKIVVDSPVLTSYNQSGTSGTWQMFDGGLIGDSFRGHIEWSFTVPSDGWWLIDLSGRLRGTVRQSEKLGLGIAVDGRALPNQIIGFTNGQPITMNCLTPWLSAGIHTLRVDVNNEIGRRVFQILGLQILAPGGFDSDANGRADWVDSLLTQGCAVAPIPSESPVSPLFIEGSSRCVGNTEVSANNTAISVTRGLGDQHWYANVPLAPNGSTSIDVTLETGIQPQLVTWSRWNAMAGKDIILRIGDSLKVGGWMDGNDQGTVQILIQGQTYSIDASAEVVKSFSQPGNYPVQVSHSNGTQTTATVSVIAADFGSAAPFYTDFVTRRNFSGVPSTLQIVGDSSLTIDEMLIATPGQSVRLRTSQGGNHVLAARIPNGPIVAFGSVLTLNVSDALKNDAGQYIGTGEDGYSVFRTPIVVTDLPVGGRVVVTIFRAGTTFMDGTTVVTLTSEDFVNGVAYLQFRFPTGMDGGYCHYIDVYDAQNNHLGRR